MTRTKRHVVIFARAPRLGVGKRRLARDIGELAAWRFYRETLAVLIRRLSGEAWHLSVAVSAAREADHPAFRHVATRIQEPGDLGHRMRRVFVSLPPGPAVIVGSDIPGIQTAHIRRAFDALRRADAAFGPAPDGGYWLAGLARRRPVPDGFMSGIRWSSGHALQDTLESLPPSMEAVLVDPLSDIDDGADYRDYSEARRRRA